MILQNRQITRRTRRVIFELRLVHSVIDTLEHMEKDFPFLNIHSVIDTLEEHLQQNIFLKFFLFWKMELFSHLRP